MKILKWLGSAILIVIIGLVVVVKYSSTTTVYECDGKQDYELEGQPRSYLAKMFLKLEEYRWWVHLWSESDGFLTVEIPDDTNEFYEGIQDSGDMLEVWKDGTRQGLFSRLSMRLSLKNPNGYYSGTCKRVDRDL